MPQTHEDDVEQTYGGLRLAMVMLVVLLFVSVLLEFFSSGGPLCLQSSLSAYYHTPVRPVFIAVLSAIGACLIIYRGSTDAENVLLDFSGFVAFFVAFVPIEWNEHGCDAGPRPDDGEIAQALGNNAVSMFVIGFLALAVSRWFFQGRYSNENRISTPAKWTIAVSGAALGAGVVFYLLVPYETFKAAAHPVAAGTLFACFLAVIILNATQASSSYKGRYYAIAGITAVVALGFFLAGLWIDGFDVSLFWVETTGIVGFGVFWIAETLKTSAETTRRGRVSEPARV